MLTGCIMFSLKRVVTCLNPFRFAGIGYIYDAENNVFYRPKPFASWTLNKEKWVWEAPVAKPTLTEEEIMAGKRYDWNEDTKEWVESV